MNGAFGSEHASPVVVYASNPRTTPIASDRINTGSASQDYDVSVLAQPLISSDLINRLSVWLTAANEPRAVAT
jgi:hypothetical protein